MTNRDIEIIKKIRDYCGKIVEFSHGLDYPNFLADEKTVFSCSFALGQIGELANKLSDEFKNTHIDLPWKQMTALRHRIVHGYDSVQQDLVWDIVKDDIPKLQENINNIKDSNHEL